MSFSNARAQSRKSRGLKTLFPIGKHNGKSRFNPLTVWSGDGTFSLMGSKPTIEQFMSHFFRERTAALKMVLENRRDYRLRYYHRECMVDSRHGVVERSEAEQIVSVSTSYIGAVVVTTGDHPNHRSRYRVKSSGQSWLIQEVDTECDHCRLFGPSFECAQCGGTGWQSWKDRTDWSKRQEQRAARTTRPGPDEESEGCLVRDSAIAQFMTDYFRERTLAWKKEVEIYGDYAKGFYSPECDWTRWVVSVQLSEAERILNIALVDTGAQVITRDFNRWRLRYHLRPAGQSWLIWEVDNECTVCHQQGRKADCFWCAGTIWEHKKANSGLAPGEEPPPA
jgi:hypothetical protein